MHLDRVSGRISERRSPSERIAVKSKHKTLADAMASRIYFSNSSMPTTCWKLTGVRLMQKITVFSVKNVTFFRWIAFSSPVFYLPCNLFRDRDNSCDSIVQSATEGLRQAWKSSVQVWEVFQIYLNRKMRSRIAENFLNPTEAIRTKGKTSSWYLTPNEHHWVLDWKRSKFIHSKDSLQFCC